MPCPKCGESVHLKGMSLGYFGAPTHYVCNTCGHNWDIQSASNVEFLKRK